MSAYSSNHRARRDGQKRGARRRDAADVAPPHPVMRLTLVALAARFAGSLSGRPWVGSLVMGVRSNVSPQVFEALGGGEKARARLD